MAPSGSLDLARSCPPDRRPLDIHLPDIDGFGVLARLRADPATRTLRAVAGTAQAMADKLKRARGASLDGDRAKPLDPARFDALLERMPAPRAETG